MLTILRMNDTIDLSIGKADLLCQNDPRVSVERQPSFLLTAEMGSFYLENMMKCPYDKFESNNKKSFSNHMRWHRGISSKGIKFSKEHCERLSKILKGINLAEKNSQWKGDKVGIGGVHGYIKRHLLKPKICNFCNQEKQVELCNISQLYKRDFSDWEWLCRRCHMKKDGRLEKLLINSHRLLRERDELGRYK